jgi:DNA-binding MarR family transcriptional regulator
MKTAARRPRRPVNGVEADIDLAALPNHIGYVIRRAQIAIFQKIIDRMAELDIRPGQFSVLTVIGANPGLKQMAVSEALGIRRTNLVAMVDELERRGLARRKAMPGDRRSHALYLTSRGKAVLARLKRLAAAHEREVTQAISPAEKRQLLRLLTRLTSAIES